MAVFTYEAVNEQCVQVNGTITAVDEASAIKYLQESELIVIDISAQVDKKRKTVVNNKKVKVRDLSLFSRQLAAMLGAGIPVTQCISTLSKQTENARLAQALEKIDEDVSAGLSLHKAFLQHPKVFTPLYCAMIGAGEEGGTLESSLIRLSNQLQKEKQLNDNIKSAVSYPKMVGGFAVIMFVMMLVFLVPVFEGMLGPEVEINAFTQITFAISNSIRNKWYIWLSVMGIIAIILFNFFKSSQWKTIWENNKISLPIVGKIIQKTVVARFCRTLATMLQGGIPIVQALQSAGPTAGSDLVEIAVDNAIEKIEAGRNISQPLQESGLFPLMMINMIAIGEEAGTLPELLDKVAEFYEEDVATDTKSLSSIIEPIMLIMVGLLVGGMLISLYMPIFSAVAS